MPHTHGQPSPDPSVQPPSPDTEGPVEVLRRRSVRTDFFKAYRKARQWHCTPLRACTVAFRFALFGDSGRFASHGGWRMSRIRRDHT